MENPVQIHHRNLVLALAADVFWGIAPDIHFTATMAVGKVAKDLGGELSGTFPAFQLFLNDLVDLVPKRFRNDWFTFDPTPFAFGFLHL